MNRIYISKKFASIVALFASFVLSFMSCKEEEKVFVTLSSSDKTINLGESYQFSLSLSAVGGAKTEGLTCSWIIKDPTIASVDQNGLVKALEVGTTILSAKLSNGDIATSQITVEKPKSILFTAGEDVYMQPQSLPDTIWLSLNTALLNKDLGLKVVSQDNDIVEVDTITPMDAENSYMVLKSKNEGETKVYISNGDLKTYCTVHVGPVVKLGWDLNKETYSNSMRVFSEDEPFEIVIYSEVLPDNEKNYWKDKTLYEWRVEQSNAENPASEFSDIDISTKGQVKFTVTPKVLGTTKFYLKSKGQEVSLVLKVVDKSKVAVKSISILNGEDVIAFSDGEGGDEDISKTVESPSNSLLAFIAKTNPQNAAATWPVEWSSSDSLVAVYDASVQGVRTLKDGETFITVTSRDKSATCKVVVKTTVTSIDINTDSRQVIMVGDEEQLSVRCMPEGAVPSITWKSSDENVAVVDENGLVRGLKEGKVNITAESGSVVSSPREITVVAPLDDYDYTDAAYIYTYSAKHLELQAERESDDEKSVLSASFNVESLENAVYNVGQEISDVTFTFKDVIAKVTSGTITVSGDKVKEFEMNLEIVIGNKTIRLMGKLESENNVEQ